MSEQQASEAVQLVTDQDLAELDNELAVADGWFRNWEGRLRDLTLIRAALVPFVGHPVTDVEAALEQAKRNLAGAEADLAAKQQRRRDLQGYIRIQGEHVDQLKAQQE